MEPEDIIQQKEWLQLDDAEKYILHDIAGTIMFNLKPVGELEYILLFKWRIVRSVEK